jgi:hypothetical protein
MKLTGSCQSDVAATLVNFENLLMTGVLDSNPYIVLPRELETSDHISCRRDIDRVGYEIPKCARRLYWVKRVAGAVLEPRHVYR